MPRVPQYQSPQVKTQPLQSPRAQPGAPLESFGGGQSFQRAQQATQGLFDTTNRIIQEEKQKADDVATTAAYTELVKNKNELLYNTENGAFLRRGQESFGVIDEYGKRFEETANRIEKEQLHNETQRQMFRNMRLKESAQLNTTLQKHVYQESKSFDDETVKSGVEVARNDAVLNYQEPGKIAESLNLQETLLRSHAQRHGIPEDALKMMIDEARSSTHSSVLTRMLNTDQDRLAQAYFEEVKDEFTAEDIIRAESALEEGSLRGESQRIVDDIYQRGLSATEAAEEIRQIDDVKLREATNKRYRGEQQIRKNAEEVDRENLFRDVSDMIERTEGQEEVPLEKWMQFTMSERQALESRMAQLRAGEKPQTDWDIYYDLKTMASSDTTKQQFMNANLMKVRHKMSDTEFKELINLQTQLRQGNDEIMDGYRSTAQVVDGTLREVEIDPNDEDNYEIVNRVRRAVDHNIRDFQRKTGREPTNEDIQNIVDGLLEEGSIPGTKHLFRWWDRSARVIELEPDQRIVVDVDDIPRTERLKIERALRDAGQPVTDEKIIHLYGRKLERLVPGRQ